MHDFRDDNEAARSATLCSGHCRQDQDHGYCLDCFRTPRECQGWRSMTFQERLEVLDRARGREAAHGDTGDPSADAPSGSPS